MSTTAVEVRYTPAQYLALERAAETRSEYLDGYIYPMAGTSRIHSTIVGNLHLVIGTHLRHRDGEVHMIDLRLRVSATGLYTYPDVVVVAGEAELEDEVFDTLLNPSAIIEVLSPSTEAIDRGRKVASYRRLDSLREFALVAQDRARVELYARQGDDWTLTELDGLDGSFRLASIACDVPMAEVYRRTPLAGD